MINVTCLLVYRAYTEMSRDVTTQTLCVLIGQGSLYRGLGRGLPSPNVRQVNGRDQRLRPDLDYGVLPRQQVVVRCRNSVKVEDFLNLFFIHPIFVQTLSDMCVLLSPVRQGGYPATRLNVCDAVTCLTSEKASDRMSNAAGPHKATAGRKC